MKSRIIAYVVSHNYDEVLERAKIFLDEYAVLKPHFEALGFQCEKVKWTDPEVNWDRFACLVPKAVWDYFDRGEEFRAFLDEMETRGIPMRNPVSSIRWNMDKRYLLDYIKAGMPTIPTTIHPRGSVAEASWFSGESSEQVVVKPAISGGAKNTARFKKSDWKSHLAVMEEVLKTDDLIIQPYAKEVEEGEYSFFFFGQKLSHAIVKIPQSGDFRAHTFFGGRNLPYSPTESEIEQALEFTTVTPTPCPYARVDVIRVNGIFCLVELEIIEPYLYMDYAATEEPRRAFAAAIIKSLDS